ncbi:MAG: hypothetical protein M3154_09390, partial [Candidatus Eremiobacteraeota bacterium]|nr:hypothetical protein [Candidatus Eremiobacteraeota bacterium]
MIVPAVVRPAIPHDTASLVVHNRVVVVFRAPLGVLSPDERAAAALRRVNAVADTLAEMPDLAPGLTEAARVGLHQTGGGGVVVAAGGRGLFTITPADIDTAGGQTLASVAAKTAQQMGQVLEAEREERSLPQLLRAAALAIAATVIFFVGLRLVRAARRALLRRLPDVADPDRRGLRIGGVSLLTQDQLLGLVRRLVRLQAWTIGLFGAYIWLAFVLTRFAYSRPWGEKLGAYLTTTISRLTLTALHAVPGLFTVFLILTAARWLTTLVAGFFDAV